MGTSWGEEFELVVDTVQGIGVKKGLDANIDNIDNIEITRKLTVLPLRG
jgi:hypothetical protein